MLSVSLVPLLLLLAGRGLPAVVLPRPPSSPNYIPQEYAPADSGKGYSEKALYQSTNVEKPDTQDYRFLEIEVRDAENVDSLDTLHGLVQAVLDNHQRHRPPFLLDNRQLDIDEDNYEREQNLNLTYPQPEVVPHSIFGVRDVGLGPSQRQLESTSLEDGNRQIYLINSSQATKNFGDEKLYYLKSGRPKVYVNFRGRTGNFRQGTGDSKVTMRLEPSAFLRATPSYFMEKKTKSPRSPPKKYDARLHGPSTTENTLVTSSELPKQIPAPPSRIPARSPIAHTTPVQRYNARRSDILPGYSFDEP